ncbi:hypothetical protein DLM76_12750 [Leptospira yasudae]|nr:hypothetical protein DLM76_12750 [Leptospira yasudae]
MIRSSFLVFRNREQIFDSIRNGNGRTVIETIGKSSVDRSRNFVESKFFRIRINATDSKTLRSLRETKR